MNNAFQNHFPNHFALELLATAWKRTYLGNELTQITRQEASELTAAGLASVSGDTIEITDKGRAAHDNGMEALLNM